MHDDTPVALLNVADVHAEQITFPAVLRMPRGQIIGAAAFERQKLPAGHVVHTVPSANG
jgi:hypothetical protein